MASIPRRVREKPTSCVYLFVDPRTQRPFCVDKGRGTRFDCHLDDTEDCEKVNRIAEFRKLGMEPVLKTRGTWP